jgi:hypothetical protein
MLEVGGLDMAILRKTYNKFLDALRTALWKPNVDSKDSTAVQHRFHQLLGFVLAQMR